MKKRILASFLAFVLSLSLLGITATAAEDEGTRWFDYSSPFYLVSAPVQVNSAGGVSVKLRYNNWSGKKLKYIYVTMTPYNRVKDPVACEMSGESTKTLCITGPVIPNPERYREDPWGMKMSYAYDYDYDGRLYYQKSGLFRKGGYYIPSPLVGDDVYFPSEEHIKAAAYLWENVAENVWYNPTISYVKIDQVTVVFLDEEHPENEVSVTYTGDEIYF